MTRQARVCILLPHGTNGLQAKPAGAVLQLTPCRLANVPLSKAKYEPIQQLIAAEDEHGSIERWKIG